MGTYQEIKDSIDLFNSSYKSKFNLTDDVLDVPIKNTLATAEFYNSIKEKSENASYKTVYFESPLITVQKGDLILREHLERAQQIANDMYENRNYTPCIGCYKGCTNACSSSCTAGCGSGGCSGGNQGCFWGCNGCEGCSGGCEGGCSSGCEGNCRNKCINGCSTTCYNSCNNGCDSGCSYSARLGSL